MIICHDTPALTEDDKLRISVSLTAPKSIEVDGKIGKMVIPAGTYASVKFQVQPMEIGEAWNWVYRYWLPVSGYFPDDFPAYELYPASDTNSDSEGSYTLEICVPVRAA